MKTLTALIFALFVSSLGFAQYFVTPHAPVKTLLVNDLNEFAPYEVLAELESKETLLVLADGLFYLAQKEQGGWEVTDVSSDNFYMADQVELASQDFNGDGVEEILISWNFTDARNNPYSGYYEESKGLAIWDVHSNQCLFDKVTSQDYEYWFQNYDEASLEGVAWWEAEITEHGYLQFGHHFEVSINEESLTISEVASYCEQENMGDEVENYALPLPTEGVYFLRPKQELGLLD